MQNKRLVSLLTATASFTLLMLSGMLGANAVSVTSSNRVATGINDLNVNGQKYDVDFAYGSFADVFGNPVAPGWTPPTLSANVQPNVPNPSIKDATDAIVTQLNGNSSNQVADVNSGTQRNYFVTGGLVDRGPDTVQVFYGQLNNQNKWVSRNVTCNYDIANNPLLGQPQCLQTLASFGLTFNPLDPAILNNPTNYFFTQPQVMFAKSTPVPEPITILGTVVAGGMGVAIKRKQKNKTAA